MGCESMDLECYGNTMSVRPTKCGGTEVFTTVIKGGRPIQMLSRYSYPLTRNEAAMSLRISIELFGDPVLPPLRDC